MERRKLILMGPPAVGKTSLAARCVHGIFSEKYISTIGVKIDKKELRVDGQDVLLQIWDLAGAESIDRAALAYIRGADACLLVADGTREETVGIAMSLKWRVQKELGDIPFALAINKHDLEHSWRTPEDLITQLRTDGLRVFKTSAKSGTQVEEAFRYLAMEALALKGKKVAS